jgi:hypothetical protein
MTSKNAKRLKALRRKRVPFDILQTIPLTTEKKQNQMFKVFKAEDLLLLHSILLSFALYEH